MKLLLENWRGYISEVKVSSRSEVIDLINNNPDRNINIDCPKGKCKKFGGEPRPLPFDYGEWTDIINPADDMGWDLIIVPSAGKEREKLVPVGYVSYAEGSGKEGNDKIIIAPDGKYNDKDLNTIESFFSPLENFNDVKWL